MPGRPKREPRTRVTFFLPAGNTEEFEAVLDVIEYLKTKRKSTLPITGFTHTHCSLLEWLLVVKGAEIVD